MLLEGCFEPYGVASEKVLLGDHLLFFRPDEEGDHAIGVEEYRWCRCRVDVVVRRHLVLTWVDDDYR
jgi:hypothetical protein